jgi:hypothetical protein
MLLFLFLLFANICYLNNFTSNVPGMFEFIYLFGGIFSAFVSSLIGLCIHGSMVIGALMGFTVGIELMRHSSTSEWFFISVLVCVTILNTAKRILSK